MLDKVESGNISGISGDGETGIAADVAGEEEGTMRGSGGEEEERRCI